MEKVLLKWLYCLSILIPAIQFMGCSGEEIVSEEETPDSDEITVAQESLSCFTDGIEFDADADSRTVYFSTNCDWVVEAAEGEWCKVSPSGGKTGDGSFVISVEENQGLEKRNTIVTLTAGTAKKTINVMQKGKTAFVEVARTSFEILPEGEIVTLDITANVSYEIEIPSDCQWIRSVETDDASFEVLANESTQERSASLVVKSVCNPVTISVIQKGVPEELVFSDESSLLFANGLDCPASGASQTISFTVNCAWTVTVEGGDGWCTVLPESGQEGEVSFKVTVNENKEETERKATVMLKAGSIIHYMTVTQEGKIPGITGGNEDYEEEDGSWYER
ncbi:BACON domain-containing protein [Bacteroides sp.]|uniref:BACON domain-containing protein n=1 Tax=Bacteroides sp. TaxID=29523 RepID=UPI00258A65C0|nr:BACON domain-containing protein [Bacteroides sp.]